MKTISKNVLLVAFALAICAAPALADDIKAGDLVISQAWSRATPGGAKVAGGYLVIENKGTVPDRLVGASADIAGKTVKLAPGGNHLMLQELKGAFKQGDKVPVTLQFEKAGKVAVSLDVQGVGAQAPADAGHSGHMDMKKMPDHSGMKMK